MCLHTATLKVKRILLVGKKWGLVIRLATNNVGAGKGTHDGNSGHVAVLTF